MKLKLEWDKSNLASLKSRGLEKSLARALKKAGGDALRTMRTEATRYVRGRKQIKAREIRKALSLRFPTVSEISGLEWTMYVKSIPIPMVEYPHRQVRKGVSVGINRGSSRKLVKSAFVATMKSGHQGIFLRRGKARLPIDELFSSKVRDAFNDNEMVPWLFAATQQKFSESFDRLLPLELGK